MRIYQRSRSLQVLRLMAKFCQYFFHKDSDSKLSFNSLPDGKVLDWAKSKAVADNKFDQVRF